MGQDQVPGGVSVLCLLAAPVAMFYGNFRNLVIRSRAKQKYPGMFESQKSGNKLSSGEIGLDIRTHASPKVGHDQVSGGVSVLFWHAAPVTNVLWKPH